MSKQVCAWCESEFGVRVSDPNTSHGICARHAEDQIKEMEDMMRKSHISPEIIKARSNRLRQTTESDGASDMAKDGIPVNAVKLK